MAQLKSYIAGRFGTLASGLGFLVTQTGGLLAGPAEKAAEEADAEIDSLFAAWDRGLWQPGEPREIAAVWERLATAAYLERVSAHGSLGDGRANIVANLRREARKRAEDIRSSGGPIVGGKRQPAISRDAGEDSRRIDLRLGW